MPFFLYEPVWIIRDGFFYRGRGHWKKEAEDSSTSVEGPGSSFRALPRTILREDLLLKTRPRFDCTIDSNPGFKRREEKVAEWRLAPLFLLSFFSASLVFFPPIFFLSFRNCLRSLGKESPLWQRSIVRLRRSMQNSRFCDKKTPRDNDDRKL